MKKNIYILILILLCDNAYSQICNPDSTKRIEVKAVNTDPNIPWESKNHWVYYNSTCPPENKLLVYLTGSFGSPKGDTLLPHYAASNGFHAVSIKHPNSFTVGNICNSDTDSTCFGKVRYEQFFGIDTSSHITIDTSNCISNRIIKLIQYLDSNYPSDNWGQYLVGNNLDWGKVVLAGHSQGGGHAAFIAKHKPVDRVIMFSSVVDYSTLYNQPAPWISSSGVTSGSKYFSFINTNDEISDINIIINNWVTFGMGTMTDTTNYKVGCNYNSSQMIYTDILVTGTLANHGSVIVQGTVPLNTSGIPIFQNVWSYLLGLNCNITTSISGHENLKDNIVIYPNPVVGDMLFITNQSQNKIINIMLFNMDGKSVKEVDSYLNQPIDISSISYGIYLIEISFGNGEKSYTKIIIE